MANNASDAVDITDAYAKIKLISKKLKDNTGTHHLAQIQKMKQIIEIKKVPIFIEQAKLNLENGKSVAIFVNYLDTLKLIAEQMEIKCIINGEIEDSVRQEAIQLFQNNQERIIICQIRAGGVGISLHDIHGTNPRVSLISLPDTASDLIQAHGRIRRSNAKTPTIQTIICVANVEQEELIADNLNLKLTNLSAINDGDFNNYAYVRKTTLINN